MKNLFAAILIVFSVFFTAFCGEDGRKIPVLPQSSNQNDIPGKIKRLQDEAEDIEERLSRSDPDSGGAIELQSQREEIALQIIHEAQIFFFNQKTIKNNGRTRLMGMLLQNESAMLHEALKKVVPQFPYLNRLTNIKLLIGEIRAGKVTFPGKIPSKDSALLREIQKMQRDALKEYHRQKRRSR